MSMFMLYRRHTGFNIKCPVCKRSRRFLKSRAQWRVVNEFPDLLNNYTYFCGGEGFANKSHYKPEIDSDVGCGADLIGEYLTHPYVVGVHNEVIALQERTDSARVTRTEVDKAHHELAEEDNRVVKMREHS